MPRRVVITGLGPVTSAGIGATNLFDRVWKRQCPACPIPDRFARKHAFRSRWYVPLPEVRLSDYGFRSPHESLMTTADRMVVLGAKLAWEDAGYELKPEASGFRVVGLRAASVVLGIGLGSLQTALESYLSHVLPQELLTAGVTERRVNFNRMMVPRTMTNSPAAWASISFGLLGSANTVNASCASGTYAIGEAFRRIRAGDDDVVLAGGVENLRDEDGFGMRGFDGLGVLTQAADGRPQPFSLERSGFLFAEGGGCLLVLEEYERALRRRAPIYAEVARYSANSDAYNVLQIDPAGRQITRLLEALSAGQAIDYLNAHGTGTVANDDVEARAIQTVFGSRASQPYINSTKGILGHTLGASGAIEAAVTALSIARGTIHGNLTLQPMEGLNLPLESVVTPVANALTVSYGFGGHNGALLMRRCNEGTRAA